VRLDASLPGNAFGPRIIRPAATVVAWIQCNGTADRAKALRP
jgi:hypothetical protein